MRALNGIWPLGMFLVRQPWAKLAPRIARALAALPSDWWALYLGHFPLQAYFVRPKILRVRSGCTHAYIAGPRLLTWLVETKPCAAEVAVCRIGNALDGAMANLPGMYAMFPMAVLQRFLGDYRVSTQSDQYGRPRSWYDAERWRYYFIFRGVRVAEAVAVMLSPFHRVTLERFRKTSGAATTQPARLIRAAGLFDDGYYLHCRPDVAAQEIDPLWHYLRNGAVEGAWPCPLFDPRYYASQSPDLGQRIRSSILFASAARWDASRIPYSTPRSTFRAMPRRFREACIRSDIFLQSAGQLALIHTRCSTALGICLSIRNCGSAGKIR